MVTTLNELQKVEALKGLVEEYSDHKAQVYNRIFKEAFENGNEVCEEILKDLYPAKTIILDKLSRHIPLTATDVQIISDGIDQLR